MAQITLLDGGVGQEIVKRAGADDQPLWAAAAMAQAPGTAEIVHRAFLEAGATVAMANTYAILPDRLAVAGMPERLAELRTQALAEARAACDAHGAGRARLAGTIGPIGASYRPDLVPDHATATAFFAEVVEAIGPSCDLLVVETVVSLDHARAALAALEQSPVPAWIAFSVDDEDGSRLRSGERLADVLPLLRDAPVEAALANCSAPEAMAPAVDVLLGSDLAVGAYANGFETITKDYLASRTVNALSARRDMGPLRYAEHAMGWVGQGATIVGGCCETGPEHIATLASALRVAGHEIV